MEVIDLTGAVKIDTIEKVMGITEQRMTMIESIVRYELRPSCKKLGDLLIAVAQFKEFTEMERVYTAYKVSEYNSRKGWFKKWALEDKVGWLQSKV